MNTIRLLSPNIPWLLNSAFFLSGYSKSGDGFQILVRLAAAVTSPSSKGETKRNGETTRCFHLATSNRDEE